MNFEGIPWHKRDARNPATCGLPWFTEVTASRIGHSLFGLKETQHTYVHTLAYTHAHTHIQIHAQAVLTDT